MKRRQFLQNSALGLAVLATGGCRTPRRRISANERLNLGIIGTGNRALANLRGVAGENIVALCDVDANYLGAAATEFSGAATYRDFRRLLDRGDLDAVVISTPDHTHAAAAAAALDQRLHVYCEKPLTHTVSEARILSEKARLARVATQLGTQIHAGNNYRRVVELIRTGAIGTVSEVHVWAGTVYGRDQDATLTPVPDSLDYDLWLGPVPHRPFRKSYHPSWWRNWWAFGGGTLADFGCHHMDLAHWALNLRHVDRVEAAGPPVDPETVPPWLVVRYEYPGREHPEGGRSLPPVSLTWYQGGRRPPHFSGGILPEWGDGNLFVGEKGMLLAGYNSHVLLPEENFRDFQRPEPTLPDSIGHHQEWIRACKTGAATTCNFDYSGALTETVLLGNVAYRTGKALEWDAAKLRATNAPEADRYVRHHYRDGWRL
jgi:predicted dehydrogenase